MKSRCEILLLILLLRVIKASNESKNEGQCSIKREETCGDDLNDPEASLSEKYNKFSNEVLKNIHQSVKKYMPCTNETDIDDKDCACYADVIVRDLLHYEKGISRQSVDESAKYGTRYKILKHRLYRDVDCMFPARCNGIEYFVLRLLPQLSDMDFVVNTRDWPQLHSSFNAEGVVFSFSKTNHYRDIMYPAWTFWAGGPAISLYPTGIGRWDLLRESITKEPNKVPWAKKRTIGFFRGSRTSDERDSLVLLSRNKPNLIDAKYTKNQAWKSPKDTLNAEPAKEVSFEEHCHYKYLFNFRGVAASFRLKHLFLCKSLVFHVGNEWNEFFYFALKPWVHYVPLGSYPTQEDLEKMLLFFKEHDDLAQQIANRGYVFIWRHLRMQDVECYWLSLLKQYQLLLKYDVTPDKELIEVKPKK